MPWSVAFMVIAIVLISMIAKISIEGIRSRDRLPDRADDTSRAEIRHLKERIQVLERVITDDRKSIDLDREIERLRDH